MFKNIKIGLSNVICLQSFTLFPEYFIGISILYVLIILVFITYSVYGLMLQKAVSECIAVILLMACYLIFNDDLISFGLQTFNNSVLNDYLSFFSKIVICLVSVFYFLIIANSLKSQRLTSFEYLLITLFSVLGLILLCNSNDLLTAYLSIELVSLSCYLLAAFKKTSSYSLDSGVKYFVVGSVSSAFFLLGSSFIYGVSGSIWMSDFSLLFTDKFAKPLDIYDDSLAFFDAFLRPQVTHILSLNRTAFTLGGTPFSDTFMYPEPMQTFRELTGRYPSIRLREYAYIINLFFDTQDLVCYTCNGAEIKDSSSCIDCNVVESEEVASKWVSILGNNYFGLNLLLDFGDGELAFTDEINTLKVDDDLLIEVGFFSAAHHRENFDLISFGTDGMLCFMSTDQEFNIWEKSAGSQEAFKFWYTFFYFSVELIPVDFFQFKVFREPEHWISIHIYDYYSRQFNSLNYSWEFGNQVGEAINDFLYYRNLILDLNAVDFSFIEIGISLLLFSMFIKLALAPFHLWSLDVYEGSPTSATFFFAVVIKLSFFVFLVRLCSNFIYFQECWNFYSVWVGLFSIFVGAFGGLKQRRLKTLIAYSSTTHMGYMLLFFNIASPVAILLLFFYLIIYMIAGLSIWSIILCIRLQKKTLKDKYSKDLGDFALLKKSNPALALALSLTMFSIAGIPPLLGFLAKMSVFFSLIMFPNYDIALLSILFSVVSTFYYIRVVKIIYFENLLIGKLYYPINSNQTLIISLLVFLLIFLFINPTILYLLTYKLIFMFKTPDLPPLKMVSDGKTRYQLALEDSNTRVFVHFL